MVYYLLGEGGKETEILGLVRRIDVCSIRGANGRVFVYVRHVRRMAAYIGGYIKMTWGFVSKRASGGCR